MTGQRVGLTESGAALSAGPGALGRSQAATTADVVAFLRRRFSWPEYAFLGEIGLGPTGRRADALVIGLYASRGNELTGFEVKVSRSDWLRELRSPAKAESTFRKVHRWWIVAPPGVVRLAEVPDPWGLAELVGDRFRRRRLAPRHEPEPLTYLDLAAIFRRAATFRDETPEAEQERRRAAEVEEAHSRGWRAGLIAGKKDVGYEADNHRRLAESLGAFERASGISLGLGAEQAERIGARVRFVRQHPELVAQGVESARRTARALLAAVEAVEAETAALTIERETTDG